MRWSIKCGQTLCITALSMILTLIFRYLTYCCLIDSTSLLRVSSKRYWSWGVNLDLASYDSTEGCLL